MSSVFSGTVQGNFTATGSAVILKIREDVDYIHVYNRTIAAANQTTAVGVKYYWQRGWAQNSQWVTFKSNAAAAANLEQYTTAGGFSLVNNTVNVPGPNVALSAISAATPPAVTTGSTATLSDGDVVRIFNTVGAQQLGGLDFTVDVTDATHFNLAFMRAIAAGTTGSWRKIPYDPYFYPPTRVITKILASTFDGKPSAIVTLSVTHAFTVGQVVRFVVPTVTSVAFGMVELNEVQATIVAVGEPDANSVTNTITVDVDVSGFTAFAWPLTTDPFSTPAQVVPVGANTAVAIEAGVSEILDAEINLGYIGIALQGGAGFPGGASGDSMWWVAGKSFSGGA